MTLPEMRLACWSKGRGKIAEKMNGSKSNGPQHRSRMLLACGLLISARLAASDWPQWHGLTRDCRLPGAEPAPTSLPSDLKPVWKVPAGGGFSSPVVAGGKLVYPDEDGQREVAHLVDARTGKEIW